jgi:hypothetical protein
LLKQTLKGQCSSVKTQLLLLIRFKLFGKISAVLADGLTLEREIHAGSSYLSSEDPRAHFGLGTADTIAELYVR